MGTLAAALCLVVAVSDGDTIKVRCDQQPEERVRLTQIDTPERGQAFGTRAKQALSDLVYQRRVELVREGKDRYGRTLGAIYVDGRHVNFALVDQGLAWCYLKYLTDPGCLDRESAAKKVRAGLWSDPQPVPPWEYRKSHLRK